MRGEGSARERVLFLEYAHVSALWVFENELYGKTRNRAAPASVAAGSLATIVTYLG